MQSENVELYFFSILITLQKKIEYILLYRMILPENFYYNTSEQGI